MEILVSGKETSLYQIPYTSLCQAKFKLKIKNFYVCKYLNLKCLSLQFVTCSNQLEHLYSLLRII